MTNKTTFERADSNNIETLKAQRAPQFQLPNHIPMMLAAPAEQQLPERFIIYSLVMGLRPSRCLEIGTHWGGSATIICAAMDDINHGKLVTVDPDPLIAPETFTQIGHRVSVIKGFSPDALSEAMHQAGGLFDFALIDGDHTYQGLLVDIEGVLPCLAENAYLLFHDSHYFEIEDAINHALQLYPNNLFDCGILSTWEAPENREVNGRPVVWGGLRLMRFAKTSIEPKSHSTSVTGDQTTVQLRTQLLTVQQQLAAIEDTRTWRWASKISYSAPGRMLSRLLKPFLG